MCFAGLITFVVAVVLVAAAPAGAQLINENFDGVTPPALPASWTMENVNADLYAWESYPNHACSGGQVASIRYHLSAAMDDWLFTPGVSLTAGWTYTLSFNYRAGLESFPENLTVYIGTAASSGSMPTQLIDLPGITSTTCLPATVTDFTVPSTGTYYIGFYGHSTANQFRLVVDDVLLVNTGVPVELMSFDLE